jgi:hypothetical protein
MSNRLNELRAHLFRTLDALADKDAPMDLDRANTIATVAQVLINSAKVEVTYLGLKTEHRSNFMASPNETYKLLGAAGDEATCTMHGIVRVKYERREVEGKPDVIAACCPVCERVIHTVLEEA